MPESAVETVRRFMDAYVAGEYDRAAGELHAEAEWHNTRSFPGPTSVYGPGAIRGFWREMFRAFAASSGAGSSGMEVERVADYGDVVVVVLHGWGGGTTSSAPFDRRWAHACRVRDGKVLRIDTYGSFQRALDVLGLRDRSARV